MQSCCIRIDSMQYRMNSIYYNIQDVLTWDGVPRVDCTDHATVQYMCIHACIMRVVIIPVVSSNNEIKNQKWLNTTSLLMIIALSVFEY